MSDQIQRPTCAVKGSLHGGRAMCGSVINAEFCGNSDPCEHKVDRNALEEKKATVESESPKLVEALRDQIAIAYMQAQVQVGALYATWDDLSGDAYKLADAMLKERDK